MKNRPAYFAITCICVITLTIILNLSCKKSPTENESQYGRRDYSWKVDTLNTSEQLQISKVWGISPNNVWAIGISSWTATSIWHFNGDRWNCDSVSRYVGPLAILGFDSTEIWLGNTNFSIWRFDGSNWSKYCEFPLTNYDRMSINTFYGTDKNNIYGVGYTENSLDNDYKGIIMHYDGHIWQYVDIPYVKTSFVDVAIDKLTNNLILSGWYFDENGFKGKLYIWDGNKIKEIYSGYDTFVSNMNDVTYITINQKIYKLNNEELILWKDITGSKYDGKIWGGNSEKDFFIWGEDGIGHYNGNDFKTIFKTDLQLKWGHVFEKEIFFFYQDYKKTGLNFCIHGKLK